MQMRRKRSIATASALLLGSLRGWRDSVVRARWRRVLARFAVVIAESPYITRAAPVERGPPVERERRRHTAEYFPFDELRLPAEAIETRLK